MHTEVTMKSPGLRVFVAFASFLLFFLNPSLVAAETITLTPTDDATVKAANPTSNYGNDTNIITSNYSSNNLQRAFLKFNLSSVSGTITQAKLYLTPSLARKVAKTLHHVTNTSWTEGNITWQNQPTLGQQIGELDHLETDLIVDQPLAITLDPTVLQPNVGGQLSLAIQNDSTANTFQVYSTEGADPPQLELTTGGSLPPPTLPGDANRDGIVDIDDYTQVLLDFGETGGLSDLVADGNVDILDLNQVITNFGDEPSPAPSNTPPPSVTTTPTQTPQPSPTPTPPPPGGTSGIWISHDEIMALSTSGPAWQDVLSNSNNSTANPDFTDQDSNNDIYTIAKALVAVRDNDTNKRDEVVNTLHTLVSTHPINKSPCWDWLGILRGLGSYVVAADIVDLQSVDPQFDSNVFRPWLAQVRYAWTEGDGFGNLDCNPDLDSTRGSVVTGQEKRPNNFGTHGSFSRIATALYLNDQADLDRAIAVYRGYLGNTSLHDAYDPSIDGNTNCDVGDIECKGFEYGDDLSWQCYPNSLHQLVGINTDGCSTVNKRGVLPDDQRRGGNYSTPPVRENYVWEALQGVTTTAEILHRAGYPAYDWENQAIKRAYNWLHTEQFSNLDGTNPNDPIALDYYKPDANDSWIAWLLNKHYGLNYYFVGDPSAGGNSSFTLSAGDGTPGKNMGFTDWTHAP